MNSNKSIAGSIIAVVIATSCCWLPAFLITFGGATLSASLISGLEKISLPAFLVGGGLLAYGIYFYFSKSKKEEMTVTLESTITCPECGFEKEETMPTNACQFFYDCENCKTILKPKAGDCCVYCSYGTVACPPIQQGESCC